MRVYNLYDWQRAFFTDKSQIIVCDSGSGTGKTVAGMLKIYTYAMQYPGSFCMIVRKTRASLTNTTLLELEKIIGRDNPNVQHVRTRSRFEFANGSIIAYYGMADGLDAERIRGATVDFALIDEATELKFDDYQEIIGRLRGIASSWRQIVLMCNPSGYSHWINQELILSNKAKRYNPKVWEAYYLPEDQLERLKNLKGNKRASLWEGIWFNQEGMVYNFNFDVHMTDPVPKDKQIGWTYYVSIDYGYGGQQYTPSVLQLWGLSSTGVLYLISEIYSTSLGLKGIVDAYRDLTQDYPISAVISDHDSAANLFLGDSGISTLPADKEINLGVELVNQRLANGGLLFFDNLHNAHYHDFMLEAKNRPTGITHEFGMYVWVEAIKNRETIKLPKPEFNHSMDAMRYMIMYLDKKNKFDIAYLGDAASYLDEY